MNLDHRLPLSRSLLFWFDENARELPWRSDRDPYRIWLSEVMLQQTTVAAVVPHFHRFLERFPTIADLAAADQAEVLRLWQGLGYYRRARDLHKAAQTIVAQHAGRLPEDADAVRALPGFGRYTANAVLSQAFDQKRPILEANSVRLLCRLFGIDEDPKATATVKQLWQLAEDLLPDRRVGDFNQALMELGALVCTPASPRCDSCPLTSHCHAYKTGRTAELPRKSPAKVFTAVREVAVVVWHDGRVLLTQRPPTGRWAEMWEFPRTEVTNGRSVEAVAADFLKEHGLDIAIGEELTTIRHGVTRFRITLTCVRSTFRGGQFQAATYPRGLWISPAELGDYPGSTPQRKLAAIVKQLPGRTRRLASG